MLYELIPNMPTQRLSGRNAGYSAETMVYLRLPQKGTAAA